MDVDERVLQRYGREIARLRRDAEITQVALARKLGISPAQMSNLERGGAQPRPRIRTQLTEALAPDGYLDRLWDELTGSSHPTWLDELADLERQAMSILEYQLVLVPSLLQTETYAHEVARTISPWLTDQEIKDGIAERIQRAQRFAEATSPLMLVVLDRGVLTHRVGTNEDMWAQLAHIVELTRRGRVSVQVVDGQHPGLVGPFKIVASRDSRDIVYAESAHSGQVIDEVKYVQEFRLRMGSLQAMALSPAESMRVIQDEMEGLRNG